MDQNTIIALWRDNRLTYAKAVDTLADRLDRLIHHRFCNWPLSTIGACWRFQPNQKRCAALKVETEMDLPVPNQCAIRSLLVEPAYTRTGFEANSAKPDTPLHAYAKQRQTVDRVLAEAVRDGDAPAVVAKAIVAAATDARPKLRYTAGPMAGRVSTLRRLAPARAFDKQIRKINRLAG